MESGAGQYTFCWRGTAEKNLVKVKRTVQEMTGLKTVHGLRNRLAKTKTFDMVCDKGKRKSQEQKEWEVLDGLRKCWEKYETLLKIMGATRNSCSKCENKE